MIASLILRYAGFVSINVNKDKSVQDFKDVKWLKFDCRGSK